MQKHYLQIFFKIAKKRNHLEPRQFLMTILCSVNIYRTVFQCFCSSFGHVTHRTQFNTRGAHFKRNFNRFCWLKYVSNNFSQGFQKRQYCDDRTMPLYMQALPTQPTYLLGYRLAGPECELKTVRGTKNPKPVLKFLYKKYSFLRVSPESEI